MPCPTIETMNPNQTQDRDRAVILPITAMAAVVIAYLLVFAVLRDPAMTDKLMNGAVPLGADVIGNRLVVVGGIGAAVSGWIAAVASRRIVPVVLVLLASVPFVPVALFALILAF